MIAFGSSTEAAYAAIPSGSPDEKPWSSSSDAQAPRVRRKWLVLGSSLVIASMIAYFIVPLGAEDLRRRYSHFEGFGTAARQVYWHKDNRTGWQSSPRLAAVTRLYGMGQFENRSWTDHIADLNDDGLAPLTKFAQDYLIRHQYRSPEECAKAQYYVLTGQPNAPLRNGIGSMVHTLAWPLMHSLNAGRIFLYGNYHLGHVFVDENCTDSNGLRTMNCVFEEISSCGFEYLNENNTMGLDGEQYPPGDPHQVPHVFKEALDEYFPVGIEKTVLKYWWHAQASAFLMRLNKHSMATLRHMRLDPLLHEGWTKSRWTQQPQQLPAVPFPMPQGAISLHVRHGDRYDAATRELMKFENHVKLAEEYVQRFPLSLLKVGFVSSEDPVVIKKAHNTTAIEMDSLTPNLDWIFYNSVIDREDAGPFQQLADYGRSRMTIAWLLQLFMAIECDAYVGSRASNWNRQIDHMRCVWLDKCNMPFIELLPPAYWPNYG